MPIYNKLLVAFKCNNCNIRSDFEEELDICGIRQENCKDFDIKFIKNIKNNEIEYSLLLKCKNCKKFKNIQLTSIKNDSNQGNIDQEHQCDKCKKKISIQAKLISNNKNEEEKFNRSNRINLNEMNYNMGEFNNNNIRFNYNNNINNYNMDNYNYMNNPYNTNNYNNNINNYNMELNNQMNYNNGNMMNNFILNNNNNNMNNLNNMMNNLNLDNNSPNTIIINVFFGTHEKIPKITQKNKKLKEIFKEMQNENPELKKYIDNIREDSVNCNGEILDITKTIDEINSEKEIITQNCSILVPDIRTIRFNH